MDLAASINKKDDHMVGGRSVGAILQRYYDIVANR